MSDEIYTLSLHDALPICHYFGLRKVYEGWQGLRDPKSGAVVGGSKGADAHYKKLSDKFGYSIPVPENLINQMGYQYLDRKSTRLNSSHSSISYAVFCLKK